MRNWHQDYKEAGTAEDISHLIDLDKETLHKLADVVKDEFTEITEDAAEIVDGVVTKLDKLVVLNENTQAAGIKLVQKIHSFTDEVTNSRDLLQLVDALAKLQTAFFSKPGNVNILNANGQSSQVSDSGISAFKSLMRSS